jgi:hypothetical protein
MANEPKPWGDCPECGGAGRMAHHPGSRKSRERVSRETKIAAWPEINCPTCAVHWRGVREAVKRERQRWLDEARAVNESLCGNKWSAFDALRALCNQIRKADARGE